MRRVGTTAVGLLIAGLNVILAVPVAYIGAMTAVAWVANRRTRSVVAADEPPTTRFVVIIPAHDEASTIAQMLGAMNQVEYPSALVSVHVVADNCRDSTAAIAATFGVEVHERDDPAHPGKGPALNWLMDGLIERNEQFDAAVFIDADTSVEAGFLRAFDRRFRAGAVAVQGHYGVRDAFDSTPTALRYCALACRHHARPLARSAIGGTCGLFGNGMAFSRELVVDRRWTDHLVEDMEFQAELFLSGVRVEYEPGARIEAEMPHSLEASVTQHQRWERGRWHIARKYTPPFLERLVHPGGLRRVAVVDMIADITTPPLSVLAMASAVAATTGTTAALLSPSRLARWNAVTGVAFVATLCVHVAVALRLVDAPRRAYRSLLHAPRFAFWKLRTIVGSISGTGSSDWVRTRRNTELAS